MAFILTSDITIGENKNVKANKVTWKSEVGSFIDTCTINLPRRPYLVDENIEEFSGKGLIKKQLYKFKEGDKVSVLLGYNKKNTKRFEGFVRRVNMGIPVQLECEGYGYQLHGLVFNKTYANTTVKQLLQDITAGTDIVLSKEIPDIPLKNVRFKNASGIKVLEWLKNEVKLSVYFNFNEIFVGTMYGKVQDRVKVKIGWNTVKDDDFKQRNVETKVNIVIREKDEKGLVKKVKSPTTGKVSSRVIKTKITETDKYSNNKELKIRAGIPAQYMKEIAQRLQTKEDYKGHEGDVVLFLVPTVTKGMVMQLDGGMYPEKSGEYFVESVSGEFGENGGRQTVKLGFLMQK
ncbi:hypothetical protein FO675_06260 [Riemerella anatipestifer]|uniref:hypothetical protein n=1 Tax=Riemerella anatipestifer TaxID=34085 RepID=UPI001AD61B24|nr:hypothetical protein [Riemerella anatipestifer]MBO4233906.1 hypothetical protein [Riemerella anatipestifer]